MNRQILIRGAAIAFAGVAASVFAAQQFMGLGPQGGQASAPAAAQQVNAASLVGAAAPADAAPSDVDVGQAALALEAVAPSATATRTRIDDREAASPQTGDGTGQIVALDARLAPESSAALADDFQPPMALAQAAPSANDASCLPELSAVPAIDALVDLRLTAPCAPNTRVVISHGDLAFSAYTDASGSFAAYVPALSQTAAFEAFLPEQPVLTAQAIVPEAGEHLRVLVQWAGPESVLLHAYHRGAAYGESGHVHASRPFDPDLDAAFILSLGEARGAEPMQAQIYSIPVTAVSQARLEVEVTLNEATCGRDVTAYVTQKGAGLSEAMEEMRISMPECDQMAGMAIVPLPLETPVQSAGVEATAPQLTLQN